MCPSGYSFEVLLQVKDQVSGVVIERLALELFSRLRLGRITGFG